MAAISKYDLFGSQNTAGSSAQLKPVIGPIKPGGQVLGATDTGGGAIGPVGPSSPGPGGAFPAAGGNQGSTGSSGTGVQAPASPPLLQAPDQPSVNYDSIFAPAFDALNQAQQAQEQQYNAAASGFETSGNQQIGDLQDQQQSRLADFGQQRQTETGKTDTAISSARRQANELLQGIQARYGGTTGTGKFSSEVLGGQATQNIATNQAALQQVLGGISQSENELKTQVESQTQNIKANIEQAKINARAQLAQAIATIGQQRGALETEKGSKKLEAVQNYQSVLADINAKNTAFQQQLYLQAQDATQKLEQMRQSAQKQYQVNLTPSNLNDFVNSGLLSPQQAQQIPLGSNVTGQTLGGLGNSQTTQPLSQVGVGTLDTKQNQNSLSSALGL